MGKALYREYRPKKLEDVVGQKHITDTLRNAIAKGAIAHAYLFTGPRGVGKTSIARILAHEINGLLYDEESMHLDIIEIDAASNRKIDEIRDLREKVHIAPTSAKYKVYIIDEVHMLTREAFNALLKTLEEPPAHVVFILATTEAHKVPETIISRTQRFSFKPIEQEAAALHLRAIANQEKIAITDDALNLLARHGRGSFRDSISMLDQLTGLDDEEITQSSLQELLGIPDTALLESLLQAVENNSTDELFQTTTKLRIQGSHPSVIAQNLIELLRNKLVKSNLKLPQKSAIQLMKTLLPLTAGAASYEALEILLLDAVSFDQNAKATTLQTKKTTKQPIVSSSEPEQNESMINHKNSPAASAKDTSAEILLAHESIVKANEMDTIAPKNSVHQPSWMAVLDSLKGHHNTLYGVLRMANADYRDNTLNLQFKFAFHHKQAAQTKHLATLRETAEKILGTPLDIHMTVVQQNTDQSPNRKVPKGKPAVDLQNVSNIFGGAELLES